MKANNGDDKDDHDGDGEEEDNHDSGNHDELSQSLMGKILSLLPSWSRDGSSKHGVNII
jgi:hypothetical protein